MPNPHKRKHSEFVSRSKDVKIVCCKFTDKDGNEVDEPSNGMFTLGRSYYLYNHLIKDNWGHSRWVGKKAPFKFKCVDKTIRPDLEDVYAHFKLK